MSLSLLGLGFTFGAKDKGLMAKQKKASAGFVNITDEAERMGKKVQAGVAPLSEVTDAVSGDSLNKTTKAVDQLSAAMGQTLPSASHKGAEAMHRSVGGIEGDEHRIGAGFGFIKDALEKLNSLLRLNRLQTFIQSISLAKLEDIAHGVENIGSNGLNLTTAFEGTITAAHKSALAMGANFGLAGKSLQKFTGDATSMGISLNIGTEKAGEAAYQVTLATKELSEVGIKSAADLAKFAEVSGVSAADVTQIFKQAGQQFNLTGDQLRQLAGSALAAGQQIGDVGGQFKQMPHILELVSRRAAVLGKKLDPKQMADFASQTLAVAGAFYNMGASEQDAHEMATSLAEKMVEAGEQFSNMFSGTADDLSDFHTALGISTGDIDQAFKTMTQGPGEFVSGLADMVLKSKKSGKFTEESMNLLRGQLSKTFGPKQSAMMINFFDKATDSQLEAMHATSKATGDLGKFAKQGFTTGRTLAESFDLMKDRFVMSFRNIGRSAATDFVDKTGKEFDRFNKQMQAVVKKGGPLGKLVEKFSEIHQIGALALIPQTLRPMAGLFGSIVKEAAPMVGVLGALGFRLNMLASPFTAIITVAALLGVWFADLRMQGKTTGQAIAIMSSKIAEGAKKLWTTVKSFVGQLVDFLAKVDWASLFNKIFDVLVTVMQGAGALLQRIPWAKIFEGILHAIGKIFEFVASQQFASAVSKVFGFLAELITNGGKLLVSLFQRAFESLGKLDIKKIASKVVDLVGRVVSAVGQAAKGLLSSLLDLFEKTASSEFRDTILKIADGIGEGIRTLHNKVFDLVESALDFLGKVDLSKAVSNVLSTILHVVEVAIKISIDALESFFSRLPSLLTKVVDLIIKIVSDIPDIVVGFLSKAGDMLRRVLPGLVSTILDAAWGILKALPGLIWKVIKSIPDIVSGLGSIIKGIIGFVNSAIIGLFQGIEDWLVKKFPEAAGVIQAVFTVLKTSIAVMGKFISISIDIVVGAFKILWNVIGFILKLIWKGIDFFVIGPIKIWAGLIKTVLVASWMLVSSVVKTVWSVIQPIIEAMGKAISFVVDKVVAVADKAKELGSSIGGFFSNIGSKVKGVFTGSSGVSGSVEKGMSMSAEAIKAKVEEVKNYLYDAAKRVGKWVKTMSDMLGPSDAEKASAAIANSTLKTEDAKYAAMTAMQKKFADDTASVLKGIPEAVKQAASSAQDELNRAFYNQLKEITLDETKSVEQRKKALDGLETWRTSKLEEFKNLTIAATKDITASNGAAAKSIEESYSNMAEQAAKRTSEAAIKAGAAVGTVQKELGVSAEEALSSLTAIAAIEPKKFSADLKIIKQVYLDFAKTAQDSSRTMLVETNKAFNEFNKVAVDHWTKQRNNITLMEFNDQDIAKLSESIGKTVDKAFTTLTSTITDRVEEAMTKAFGNAFARVIVDAKKFSKDLMLVMKDLFSQMVKGFGSAWVKILEFTTNSLAAISADTARAVLDLRRIDMAMRSASVVKADAVGTNVMQDVKLDTTKTDLENLYQATHHPEWYEQDMKLRIREVVMAVNNLTALMAQAPRTSTPVSASKRAADVLRNDDIGIGANRAVVRINGSQR